MNFEITKEQLKKVNEWSRQFPYSKTAIGGDITFSFTPTTIGLIVKAKHYSGAVLDLSDYDSF